jgi:hypothetical protein
MRSSSKSWKYWAAGLRVIPTNLAKRASEASVSRIPMDSDSNWHSTGRKNVELWLCCGCGVNAATFAASTHLETAAHQTYVPWRMNDWKNEWWKEWMIERMNDWKNEWLKEWMIERMNDWKNEWLKEWMIERKNDWKNEWLKECMIERMNDWKKIVMDLFGRHLELIKNLLCHSHHLHCLRLKTHFSRIANHNQKASDSSKRNRKSERITHCPCVACCVLRD